MERTFTLIILIFLPLLISAQQLNLEAEVLKEEKPGVYDGIKCHADNVWEGYDSKMFIHTINVQSESYMEVMRIRESGKVNKSFLINAMVKWEYEKCHGYNWRMVLFELERKLRDEDY